MAGFTPIPRWTRDAAPGVGAYAAEISADLMDALRGVADELGVPLGAVLLAAHAKVLGALAGESEVCTGYEGGEGPPSPLRMTLAPHSWRDLVFAAARASSSAERSRESPVGDPGAGPAELQFETVFRLGESGAALPVGIVLHAAFEGRDARVLSLRYSTEVLDGASAARIAGYHVAALSRIAADPDAGHARANLLSADERAFQIHGLAGPSKGLPERLAHELFELQARLRPDAIAAVHRDERLTYRELNARANEVARALTTRGLGPESVVAVATERNLDWLVAVLAVLKSGGAYLPIEPQFPADRIAQMLTRADCRLVLAERGRTSTLDRALEWLPRVERVLLDDAGRDGHADDDLLLPIPPRRLAYVFFTSGSTGEPKGAMCEHAGLLNHLLAKIEDLEIGEGDVVAQTAPQCFDISLWQLLAALLVGGRTVIVEQETVLDADRFLDAIDLRRVNVVQVVPSYFEVLVASLTRRPSDLPDLRVVVATGEALTSELARRWFAVQPGIRLVNAYGLTETSDDTNHEILDRAPGGERVALGRPIRNAQIYVLDEHLSLAPLGAPGEICFSGVCVGRGYIHDPERTGRAFVPDPHRAGRRLYRSGDFGRWRPDGKLQFLGRRDAQVKVAGFRIEIGEIESAMLRVPGVRAGAVVVAGGTGRGRRLVAFYSAERRLDTAAVRDRLRGTLPAYMVPAAFQWQKTLPLTGNGKIDRKALATLAGEMDAARRAPDRPESDTERRLADRWAEVLGIPRDRIDARAHFYDLGGTSLSVLRLAIALGRKLSFQDIHRHPVLADQAALLESRGGRGDDAVAAAAGGSARGATRT